jgi:tRNA dimethylallyltransferase
MIVILGPTATGKTRLAAMVAARSGGEVISADSRQVYRNMDIGTGKDLDDYVVDGVVIPSHLVDIASPGSAYNVFQYQHDFVDAYKDITGRGKTVILCGGTGMYLEAVLKGYMLIETPENLSLRASLEDVDLETLVARLASYGPLHNITDTMNRERTVRAIEIAEHYAAHPGLREEFPDIKARVFGISLPREVVRARITERLEKRLQHGMLEEVRRLLDEGISPEKLKYYGLEYRYLTGYILGEINYNEMYQRLRTAIHQFSKRQMTWFRRMEKQGTKIHWIDGRLDMQDKVNIILDRGIKE